MSICPKNKSSKARRDKRRANWKFVRTAVHTTRKRLSQLLSNFQFSLGI